jgi:hypothetical protein
VVWDAVVVAYREKVEDAENLSYTRYWVVLDPPLFPGADQARATVVFPGVAVFRVGALAVVAGVTLFDAPDAPLVPAMFVAVTVKV